MLIHVVSYINIILILKFVALSLSRDFYHSEVVSYSLLPYKPRFYFHLHQIVIFFFQKRAILKNNVSVLQEQLLEINVRYIIRDTLYPQDYLVFLNLYLFKILQIKQTRYYYYCPSKNNLNGKMVWLEQLLLSNLPLRIENSGSIIVV